MCSSLALPCIGYLLYTLLRGCFFSQFSLSYCPNDLTFFILLSSSNHRFFNPKGEFHGSSGTTTRKTRSPGARRAKRDPGERLPQCSFRGSGVRGEFPLFTLYAERSVDRGQEQYHFSSGRVDVESFPARDTVPLRVVAIDLSTLDSLLASTNRSSTTTSSSPIPSQPSWINLIGPSPPCL